MSFYLDEKKAPHQSANVNNNVKHLLFWEQPNETYVH